MPRRVSLPGAAELFRTTEPAVASPPVPESPTPDRVDRIDRTTDRAPQPTTKPTTDPAADPPADAGRTRGSGRVRHDEKITVYVSSDELLALERARLVLRAEHGMAVDRGRIVREALALALADLDADGADAELVRRLSSS